ncbi:hypothetical protein EJ110_NYTH31916 [Nymphaea thermarum]|nr:hypothetical protein EJ110_NYTH31916 [Nymphaea thermarum]
MATSRDIQEVVSKLSSDKSKTREVTDTESTWCNLFALPFACLLYRLIMNSRFVEGVKLLGTWMEGERAISFCKLLSRNTAKLRHDDIPHCNAF